MAGQQLFGLVGPQAAVFDHRVDPSLVQEPVHLGVIGGSVLGTIEVNSAQAPSVGLSGAVEIGGHLRWGLSEAGTVMVNGKVYPGGETGYDTACRGVGA